MISGKLRLMAVPRTSREQWSERIAAWDASGLSCREYARRAGVNGNTLSWWRWKLRGERPRRRRPERRASKLPFVEVTTLTNAAEEEASTGGNEWLELTVGNVTVRLPHAFEERTLARVLRVLERRT